jgi:hypothetical protein
VADQQFGISPVTEAEVLGGLGRLAMLRAETSLKMPDCCAQARGFYVLGRARPAES